MRLIGWLASAMAFVAGVMLPGAASADSMDPALARLVLDGSCRVESGGGLYYNPTSGYSKCQTDDAAFAKLIAQYGFAIAPTAMHSARTTGFGGFEIGFEGAFTKIDKDADYWQKGTQGAQDPITKNFSFINSDPDGTLGNYSLKIRKGFPFGFEITGVMGFVGNTNIVTAGADVRLSLLEGFRRGIPAIFPEIAAGAGVRTVTGTEEFQLTVLGVDGQISKPIPIGGAVVITPYIGYQWIKIFGDSGLVDLTPNTDSVNLCNYAGPNNPATPDPSKNGSNGQPFYDGQPVCATGSSADFNNTVVFDQVRLERHRLNFGLQFRFQMVKFSGHFIKEVGDPIELNKPEPPNDAQGNPRPNVFGPDANGGNELKQQWTIAFDIGAQF